MKMNKNVMIIGGMVLATIIAFLLINFLSGSKGTDTRETINELTNEISELESDILDLEVVMQDIDKELDQKKRLLDEKYDMINVLTDKVDELEREGKVDKSTIRKLRQQLQEAKNRVADASQIEEYKKEIDQLVADNAGLTRNSDDNEIALKQMDSLNQELQNQIAALAQQVVDCGTQNAVVRAASDDQNQNQDDNQNQDNTEAERLPGFTVENVVFYRNNGRKSTRLISRKGLEEITINFKLVGYKIPNTGVKDIYVVMQNAVTKKVFQSTKNRSKSFNVGGEQTPYTALAQGNYQGIDLSVSRPIYADSQIEAGTYYVYFYYEGKLLNKDSRPASVVLGS